MVGRSCKARELDSEQDFDGGQELDIGCGLEIAGNALTTVEPRLKRGG